MRLIITEENSSLKYNNYIIPPGVKKHLEKTLKAYDGEKTVDGYKRINNLINSTHITYQELKRIKNFFDTFSGDKAVDITYTLNGGDTMRMWVETVLNKERDKVNQLKHAKSRMGISNAFKRTHTKQR